MNSTGNHTAILFFSRTARAEHANKSFFQGKLHTRNIKFTNQLISGSVQKIKGTGLPFYQVDETAQEGISFGERLTNAICKVFDKGYDKIIITGNDCPQLSTSGLLEAYRSLEVNDFVFGPTGNGGLYLIGLSVKHFLKEKFKAINWQTSSVANECKLLAESSSDSIVVLPELTDLNNQGSIMRISHKLSCLDPTKLMASSILACISSCFHNIKTSYFTPPSITNQALRAPPLLG